MSEQLDHEVVVVGGGMAGLTAAYMLRDRDVVVLEEAPAVGGRMYSEQDDVTGLWGNYGAQMITGDRVKVVQLANEVGCRLIPVRWAHVLERARVAFQGMRVDGEAADQLQETIRRLEAEQARPRPLTDPSIDQTSFGAWLGDVRPAVREFWEDWSQGLANAAVDEISLYAALCLWGDQRVSPWASAEVPRHELGDCVVEGGTGQLGLAIGAALGDRLMTGTTVTEVAGENGGYAVTCRRDGQELSIRAERVVVALPAPAVLQVAGMLPQAKRDALAAVTYGRFLVTPIWVTPAGRKSSWQPSEDYRPDQTYALPAFPLRTPPDPEEAGACYQSWVNDRDAGAIWNDSDESIRAGVRAAFLKRFPDFADRVAHIGIKRWECGLPKLAPGRMTAMDELMAPVGGIHFCGDYTEVANLEGSAASGMRVAQEILETTTGG